jgi:hypothetical protein
VFILLSTVPILEIQSLYLPADWRPVSSVHVRETEEKALSDALLAGVWILVLGGSEREEKEVKYKKIRISKFC